MRINRVSSEWQGAVVRGCSALLTAIYLCCPAGSSAGDDYRIRSRTTCKDFPSNDSVGDILDALALAHPEIARRLVIGTSVEGREIYAIRISADPEEESVEPEARIIGAIHGNECMAMQVVLNAAEWIVEDYGSDPFITHLVDDAELVVVPLLNPDGYTGEQATRENANNVDLNRNLHFAWIDGGSAPFSEPETRALRDLSQQNSFNVGLSYHTVAHYVNASWNYTPHHPPDEALIQAMGEAYAGDSDFIPVFGWDWYNIEGDVNDWSLGTRGTFDWTLELMSDYDNQWDINRTGLEAFLSFLFQGVRGQVIDAATGKPLSARIEVAPEGAPVFTDPDVGDYHRILLPGRYDIRAFAEGYQPGKVTDVEVVFDETVTVDFALEADPERPGYAFAVNGMSLPKRIPTRDYDTETYPNETMAWNALGAPDGLPFSISADPENGDFKASSVLDRPVGSITLDMGAFSPVTDVDGPDLLVVSAEESDDSAAVLVADDQDGPFVEAMRGAGTMAVDIGAVGVEIARYVRVLDLNDTPFEDARSGYDLDGIINLSMGELLPDAGVWPDDGGVDSDYDTDAASGDTLGAMSGGCTCRTTADRPFRFAFWILLLLGV
jgi:hypothetical protein